jgi:hypothetical protein
MRCLTSGVRDDSGCQLGCQGPRKRYGGTNDSGVTPLRLAILLVGDTGFEPVTSSVSAQAALRMPPARRREARTEKSALVRPRPS